MNAVTAMAENYDVPVIYSTHPRSKKFIDQRGVKFHHNVPSLKPFGFSDYNNLQLNAFCVVFDVGPYQRKHLISTSAQYQCVPAQKDQRLL